MNFLPGVYSPDVELREGTVLDAVINPLAKVADDQIGPRRGLGQNAEFDSGHRRHVTSAIWQAGICAMSASDAVDGSFAGT
jgi:hypothetical protein